MLDLLLGYIIFTENPSKDELPRLRLMPPEELIYQPSIPRIPSLDIRPYPQLAEGTEWPAIDAKGALLMDINSGTILFEKNANAPLPMASLTKIMTAVVAMENYNLSDEVVITADMRNVEGNRMWLYGNERISVYDLLLGALIPSGNDAANALAYHMGYDTFIARMNQKAQLLGMTNTNFTGAIGFDNPQHYTTARDMATLTKYALKNQTFRDIVQKGDVTVTTLSGYTRTLNSTNSLSSSDFIVKGVKTGTTPAAGECLVSLVESPQGHKLLLVVLGSSNRYGTSRNFLEWAYRNIEWR